jgi:hypothetical protein
MRLVGPRAVLSAMASVYKFLLAIVVQFLGNGFCTVTREKHSLLSDSGQGECSANISSDINLSGNHIPICLDYNILGALVVSIFTLEVPGIGDT